MNAHLLPPSDLSRWADPLVGDVIGACYRNLRDDHRDVQYLVRCQGMLWRALLTGVGNVATFHKEVVRMAFRLGVGEHQIEDANRQVLTELMLVIASRYARSPKSACKSPKPIAASRNSTIITPDPALPLAKLSAKPHVPCSISAQRCARG